MEELAERPNCPVEDVNEYLRDLNTEVFGRMAVWMGNLEAITAVNDEAGLFDESNYAVPTHIVEHELSESEGSVSLVEVFDEPLEEIRKPMFISAKGLSPRNMLATELEKVSLDISLLSEEQKDMLDDYCARNGPPLLKSILKQRAEAGEPVTWSHWLADESTDAQLLNFLQWHTYALRQEQGSESVRKQITEQRRQYKDNVIQAVNDGWLPESAYWAVREVDHVPVYLGDVFDTLMQERTGYYWKEQVVLAAPNTNDAKNYIVLIAQHEFNHAVLGRFGNRWLNEAITEHIASTLKNGDVDIIDPWLRKNDDFIYREERQLLAELLEGGQGKAIPAKLATLAYAEQPEENKHKNAFIDALEMKWGHLVEGEGSVLDLLDAFIGRAEDRHMRFGASTRQAQRAALNEAYVTLAYRPHRIFGKNPLARAA